MRNLIGLILVAVLVSACNGGGAASPQMLTSTTTSDPVAPAPIQTIIPAPSPSPSASASPSPSPSPSPSASPYVFSGLGTVASPYQLSTPEDVQHIGDYPSAVFRMMHNIDMSGYDVSPIPVFSGVIKGYSYQINNLSIESSGSDSAALVVSLTGIIDALNIQSATIGSQSGYAAIFAYEVSGTIENCQILSATITSPQGGNGQTTGTGNPFYTIRDNSALVTTDQGTVDFNGYNFSDAF